MLPEIVEAVGNKTTVLFDSGIRTGTDVIKALSRSESCLVGRLWVYGLEIAGEADAKRVFPSILAVSGAVPWGLGETLTLSRISIEVWALQVLGRYQTAIAAQSVE